MGRPLNKKYFNSTTGELGESVVSYTFSNRGTYTALPTVGVSAPALAGGVSAAGALTMRAKSAIVAVGGANYAPGDVLTAVGGTSSIAATFTVATVNGGGAVLTVTPLVLGSYTALPTNPVSTLDNSVAGAGATLTISWEVLAFTVTTAGSGYISAADAALTFSPASTTASTAVLTNTNSNVILAHAKVVGSSSVLDADISKQTSTNEYVMTTSDGTSICTLVPSNSPLEGQAYIIATDALNSTYWVTKITAHLAVLEPRTDGGSGYVYVSGDEAPWSFDKSLDASGLTVQIENV